MRGLFKRKGSDIWRGRFRVHEGLWRQRERLVALGVMDIGKAQEFRRSTGKLDRDEAGEAYRAMLVAWDAKMGAWQALLDAGPTSLSHKQRIALAADHAKAFLARHEDEPFEAPSPPRLPDPPEADNAAWWAAVECMAPDERETLKVDLREYLNATGERRSRLAFRLIQKHPSVRALIGPDLAAGLEAMHGVDTGAALAARGLHVDAMTRRLMNLEAAAFMGAARRGLGARRGGDYSPVKELEAAPAFVASAASPESKKAGSVLSLEDLLDHKAKTTSIRPKTVSDNRAYLRKFAEFLGHDDARRVQREDVRRWRDSLIETDLSPKTIEDKYLSAVRAVLSHGVKEFDLPFNAASGIADNRPRKAPERSPGWTEAEGCPDTQSHIRRFLQGTLRTTQAGAVLGAMDVGLDMKLELVRVGHGGHAELYLGVGHEGRDEGDLAAQAVQLGDKQFGSGLPHHLKGGGQLGPVVMLA